MKTAAEIQAYIDNAKLLLAEFDDAESDVAGAWATKAIQCSPDNFVSCENMDVFMKYVHDTFVRVTLLALALEDQISISIQDGEVVFSHDNYIDQQKTDTPTDTKSED